MANADREQLKMDHLTEKTIYKDQGILIVLISVDHISGPHCSINDNRRNNSEDKLCFPSLQNIENVRSQNRAEFHALFVPNRSLLCDKRLQDLGVYGSFTFIDELGTFWFPLEADLISMEAPSIFADFHLESVQQSRL